MQIDLDSSSSSDNSQQIRRIYDRQIKKKQDQFRKKQDKQKGNFKIKQENNRTKERKYQNEERHHRERGRSRSRSRDKKIINTPQQIRWHIYQRCPTLPLQSRISHNILQLPIYKKKEQILAAIMANQFVLVTGQTGCGKSTQVPRLIYEYLRNIGDRNSKIMCVQPRRLAVLNLHSILDKQMYQRGQIGYQIGMKSFVYPQNRIVFVTNGIFMQRLVHSTQFFNEYPFIILDEVHERDIDTDFILLTIKRVIREYPKVRIVLMSATIDNELFRYYFASDHIDNILTEQNFYKKIIMAKQNAKSHKMQDQNAGDGDENFEVQSDDEIYQKHEFSFMKAKYPCPTINVTEPGKYTRKYYYLDTVNQFLPPGCLNIRWGSIVFSDKYPSTHKELYETVSLIIQQIVSLHKNNQIKASVLIFMPGLAQIQNLSQALYYFFRTERVNRQFDIIHVHSSILNEQITKKLHSPPGYKFKIIIATNIAESSITVLGVKYVIDFCLSKEVKFDLKSRMENLELVWASQASCNQRAGRTGRVCDGVIFRMLQKSFYQKLPQYSTPEIQRSSLDKLILRIKLLHECQKKDIFTDPGQVLGSAIQPPKLKNIDTSIKSLQFCGGLEFRGDEFYLTNLGRFYIDIPIDITYCKLLIISNLFGTYEDMVILVSILSQSKNAIRRGNIDKNYMKYYQTMDNLEGCDFYALINLYKQTEKKVEIKKVDRKNQTNNRSDQSLSLQIYYQVNQLIKDIKKRMSKKQSKLFEIIQSDYQISAYKQLCHKLIGDSRGRQSLFRFKMTIMCGFIENILKVRQPIYDEKQDKRIKFMKRNNIRLHNTVCLLGSTVIKKPDNFQAQQRLKKVWIGHLERSAKIPNCDLTVTHGLSYLHFKEQKDLNKFLFIRYVEQNKKSYSDDRVDQSSMSKNYLSIPQILRCFGEMDHMQQGRPVTFGKEQTVAIDNYSLNRVVNVNEGDNTKFLVANNIAKQSSRMVARYTSLLPTNIKYLDIIGHLLFYPFVSLVANKQKDQYQFLQLKRKHRIRITYNLTDQQIQKANIIRGKIRDFLSLNPQSFAKFDDFRYLLLEFVYLQRSQIVEQERWQQSYLTQLFENKKEIKIAYEQIIARFKDMNIEGIEVDKNSDKIFMNDIVPIRLRQNFFTNPLIAGMTVEQRKNNYNAWKIKKLKELKIIEDKALNHEPYLACGQDSCGLKLAKLKKVGPVVKEIYRDLFQVQQENVVPAEFNQFNNHFCTLLLGNYVDYSYKTYSCTNGHYFGVMIEGEKRVKILPFSQLMIIYPDGSAQKAQFERLQMKQWKRKSDERLNNKFRLKISTYCFICDELLQSFKQLENHIKQGKHSSNVKQFKKSISYEVKVKANQEDEGY